MAIKKRWGALSGSLGESINKSMSTLPARLWSTIRHNWYLGFTSFGGPPVHFKIFHDKYVKKLSWVDEQMYQEVFSICQALSGPASTKMHYCINLLHDGFIPAVLGFIIWSLPGAIGMYGLAIGVSNVGESLPRIAYALLSGLNAATVGIIVLAAVQLSEKAITDKMTRIVVFLAASAGMLYNALWYFPLLMAVGGLVAIAFDFRWFHRPVRAVLGLIPARIINRRDAAARDGDDRSDDEEAEIEMQIRRESDNDDRPTTSPPSVAASTATDAGIIQPAPSTAESEPRVVPQDRRLAFNWKSGLALIVAFFISFTVVMVLRGSLPVKPRLYSLFANMYLAGTIIFGGGPVVIPLLREYIVAENWVSPRDFLIGLALIQAFPGPNFNFAVYLGSLTAINGGRSSAAGAVVAFLGIFAPGLILVHGTMGIWSAVRGWRAVKSGLRGVNAAAVGLIYTAVYRLWQIGYIDVGFEQGTSLAVEPWWVVVTATSYVGGYWFGVQPAVAIVAGGVMGMIWYGIVSA